MLLMTSKSARFTISYSSPIAICLPQHWFRTQRAYNMVESELYLNHFPNYNEHERTTTKRCTFPRLVCPSGHPSCCFFSWATHLVPVVGCICFQSQRHSMIYWRNFALWSNEALCTNFAKYGMWHNGVSNWGPKARDNGLRGFTTLLVI